MFPRSEAAEGCIRMSQQSAVTWGVPIGAVGRKAAEEIVAPPVPRPLVESLVHFFEPATVICLRAPGRRSKVTGLRTTDRLRPLQGNESQELDAWVESSVAPLLNFCRQETRRFSDVGDAAVFLINWYCSVEAPLRRFAVCRVYARLLEELIEQQLTLLHQVETKAFFSRLELHETLDAVRREVCRLKSQRIHDASVAEQERDQERVVSGTLGYDAIQGKFQVSYSQNVREVKWWEGRPNSLDANDDVQVGGALSPAEPSLQEPALLRFFKNVSSTLYELENVELRYVGRITNAKRRSEARRWVMKDVVAAYAEIYECTKRLGLAVHTPGEVTLLVAT